MLRIMFAAILSVLTLAMTNLSSPVDAQVQLASFSTPTFEQPADQRADDCNEGHTSTWWDPHNKPPAGGTLSAVGNETFTVNQKGLPRNCAIAIVMRNTSFDGTALEDHQWHMLKSSNTERVDIVTGEGDDEFMVDFDIDRFGDCMPEGRPRVAIAVLIGHTDRLRRLSHGDDPTVHQDNLRKEIIDWSDGMRVTAQVKNVTISND